MGVSKKTHEKYIVETYLKPLGINQYTNYCAAFVSYCLDKANSPLKIITALAQKFITKKSIKARDVLEGRTTVPKGTVVVWKWIGSWKGHVGFTLKDWSGAKGITVEGNTSSNNTREGGNVEIKNRRISAHTSFRITHFTLVE